MIESMKTSQGQDVKALAAGYKIATEDIPGAILKQALGDFIKGQAQGHSAVFLPTPGELAQYCEKIRAFYQARIRYAQSLLGSQEVAPPQKRVSREKLAALVHEMQALNQTRH